MPECVDVESGCHVVRRFSVVQTIRSLIFRKWLRPIPSSHLYFDVNYAALYVSFFVLFLCAFEYETKQSRNTYLYNSISKINI